MKIHHLQKNKNKIESLFLKNDESLKTVESLSKVLKENKQKNSACSSIDNEKIFKN